ncbi:hypothetical protein K492DRAFT_204056 [Lichtheimia hyalospora FSU 10163]|nr:hypothetical protein K492DRAFT_204056 [Lichtheimia hyalospora FSU 10163]
MFQAPSGLSLSTPARRRPRTNQQQLAILNDFYWNTTAYPNRQQLQRLAQQLGFGHDSVNTWFQNHRQSLRRSGRDDRLIQTGHRRNIQNQDQVLPHPAAAPLHNIPPITDAYGDDDDGDDDDPPRDDPPSDDPPSVDQQQKDPPLYRPIPHHANAMNPLFAATFSDQHHSHTSAFTSNPTFAAAGSSGNTGGGSHMHNQSQNPNVAQQQSAGGKATTVSGKQPLEFYFYHNEYPMQSIAETKVLQHPPSSATQHP